MAFYDNDIDEDLLVEIPCEFCNDPIPLLYITEHQTGCRYDLVRITEPTVEEIEEEFTAQEENGILNSEISKDATKILETQPESKSASLPNEDLQNSPVKKGSNIFSRFLEYIPISLKSKNDSLPKETTPPVKENVKKNGCEKDFLDYEVREEDFEKEYETFTSGSIKNKKSRVEEKPSFKGPAIPVLANSDSKSYTHNDLPDSDNEETETLEQLWEKAKVKLAQRSREMEGKTI